MISSKVRSVLRDIKKIYQFKFIMIGDFHQLDSVEPMNHDVQDGSVFAELCDGQMLELTKNWRAENDPEFADFISDLRIVRILQGHSWRPSFTFGNVILINIY